MRGLTIRLIILVMVIVGLVLWQPGLVKSVPYGDKIIQFREQVLASQPAIANIASAAGEIDWQALWATVKEQKLPQNPFTGEKKEIKVEELAGRLTNELRQIPQEQAKVIKTNFCADVVAEALKQGEVAGAQSRDQ